MAPDALGGLRPSPWHSGATSRHVGQSAAVARGATLRWVWPAGPLRHLHRRPQPPWPARGCRVRPSISSPPVSVASPFSGTRPCLPRVGCHHTVGRDDDREGILEFAFRIETEQHRFVVDDSVRTVRLAGLIHELVRQPTRGTGCHGLRGKEPAKIGRHRCCALGVKRSAASKEGRRYPYQRRE